MKKKIIYTMVSLSIFLGIGLKKYFSNPIGFTSSITGHAQFHIPNKGMAPTLLPGDYIVVNTNVYKSQSPQISDIITFYSVNEGNAYVKRVIGREGDEIEINEGIVYINGSSIEEPYLDRRNVSAPNSLTMPSIRVPPDSFFVLADNRDSTRSDSRFGWFVPKEKIIGKVVYALRKPFQVIDTQSK